MNIILLVCDRVHGVVVFQAKKEKFMHKDSKQKELVLYEVNYSTISPSSYILLLLVSFF